MESQESKLTLSLKSTMCLFLDSPGQMGIVFLIPYSYPVWVGWAGRRGERNKEAELLSVHSVHIGFSDWMQDLE